MVPLHTWQCWFLGRSQTRTAYLEAFSLTSPKWMTRAQGSNHKPLKMYLILLITIDSILGLSLVRTMRFPWLCVETFTKSRLQTVCKSLSLFVSGSLDNRSTDPLFFLHHAQLDRIWWLWQQRRPRQRVKEYLGASGNSNSSLAEDRNASLTDTLPMGGFFPEVQVADIMSTESHLLCYRYEWWEQGRREGEGSEFLFPTQALSEYQISDENICHKITAIRIFLDSNSKRSCPCTL